jgi:hypothetical protein
LFQNHHLAFQNHAIEGSEKKFGESKSHLFKVTLCVNKRTLACQNYPHASQITEWITLGIFLAVENRLLS